MARDARAPAQKERDEQTGGVLEGHEDVIRTKTRRRTKWGCSPPVTSSTEAGELPKLSL